MRRKARNLEKEGKHSEAEQLRKQADMLFDLEESNAGEKLKAEEKSKPAGESLKT